MAGFLYGVKDDTRQVNADKVKAWGLSYAFTGGIDHRQVNSGPWGHAGAVFCDTTRQGGRTAGYHPDQQTWRKLPTVEGRPELWVGYWNEAKPGPEDLKRAQLIRGPKIQLADGNAWQIPVVRRYDDAGQKWESELPAYVDYNDAGEMVRGEPLAEYAALWDATAPLADQKFSNDAGESSEPLSEQAIMAAVVALLQANYVVALPELALMRAMQENDIATIVMVSCRYSELIGWIDAVQKKSDPSEASGTTS